MANATLNIVSAIIVGGLAAVLVRTALLEPIEPLEPKVQATTQLSSAKAARPLRTAVVQRPDGFDIYQQALALAANKSNLTPNWLGHYVLSSGLASEGLTLGPNGEFAYYLQGCLGKSNQTLGQFAVASSTISLVAQPFSAKFATDLRQKPPYESQYSSMPHEWQLRWWLDDAGQRSAPFLLPSKLQNDFIAKLRDGCFDPARANTSAWREIDVSNRLQGQPELTPTERYQVLRKAITATISVIEQPKGAVVSGGYLHLTLNRGARDGVFVGEEFDFPFRVVSVLENSAVVAGLNIAIDKPPTVGDKLTSSAPGTLIPCPSEPDLSVDAAFSTSRLH